MTVMSRTTTRPHGRLVAIVASVATAKSTLEANNATRAAALAADSAALATSQSDAETAGDGAMAGLS